MLRGADHEGDESCIVPLSDAGRTCVVKATESDSSLTDSLTDSGTEGARLCFMVLTTKQTNPASCPAAQGHTKQPNLASSLTGTQAVKQANLASTAAHRTELPVLTFLPLTTLWVPNRTRRPHEPLPQFSGHLSKREVPSIFF